MRWWLPICVLPNGYVGDLVLVFIFEMITIFILYSWYTWCVTYKSPTYEDMIYFTVILQHHRNGYTISKIILNRVRWTRLMGLIILNVHWICSLDIKIIFASYGIHLFTCGRSVMLSFSYGSVLCGSLTWGSIEKNIRVMWLANVQAHQKEKGNESDKFACH